MSKDFDWQTEEEAEKAWAGWDEPSQPPPQPDKGFDFSYLRRHWRLIVVVGVLSIIVGVVVWRQVSQRAEAALQIIQADVVSSYNLTHTAAQNGDEELFRSLLSGRNTGWTQANLFLFQHNQLFDRTSLGLEAEPVSLPFTMPQEPDEQAADEATVEVSLSPDLTEAEVAAVRPFTVLNAGRTAGAETVLLRQTAVYRRGSQHWLLSPPLNEYWGESLTIEGERLTLIVPERDVAIGTRLAADLDDILIRACNELTDLNCPSGWQIALRLNGDPAVLRDLAETPFRLASRGVVELPTPTLVGLPVEDNEAQAEAGYQALLRGYAAQLLRTTTADLLGYNCCQQVIIYNALVDYQLSQLGLQPWPVSQADYRRVLDQRVRVQDMQSFWRVSDNAFDYYEGENWPSSLYTLLDFLLRTLPESSPAQMIRYLERSEFFDTWFEQILADQPSEENSDLLRTDVDRAWWLAAYQAGAETAPAAVDLPAQELYMTCTSLDDPEGAELSTVLHYAPDSNTWQEVYRTEGYAWPVLLPGAEQLLLQEFSPREQQWGLTLWRGDRLQPLVNETSQARLTFGETDPAGRFLVAYAFDDELQQIEVELYDLDECADGNCAAVDLPGFVHWSPEGEHTIYEEADGNIFPSVVSVGNRRWNLTNEFAVVSAAPLFLGMDTIPDADELQPIGEGYSPFWLSEDEYGYIRAIRSRRSDQEIVLGRVGETGVRPLLSTADLEPFLPDVSSLTDHNGFTNLLLAYVAPHPTDHDLLFIAVVVVENRSRELNDGQMYIFSVDRNSRQPLLRLRTDFDIYHSLGFSPDGRYLVVTGRDESLTNSSDPTTLLLLHDIENNETTPFLTRQPAFIASNVYDWSADGQWLSFVMADNLVAVVAPEERYARPLIHSHGACTSVAWLNE